MNTLFVFFQTITKFLSRLITTSAIGKEEFLCCEETEYTKVLHRDKIGKEDFTNFGNKQTSKFSSTV